MGDLDLETAIVSDPTLTDEESYTATLHLDEIQEWVLQDDEAWREMERAPWPGPPRSRRRRPA